MGRYDLCFSVCEVLPDVEARVAEVLDVTFARHGTTCLLSVTAEGPSAVTAAKDVVELLAVDHGIAVRYCHEDLVTRADIADRAGTTVQAVGQWVRNVRHKRTPFPEPYNFVAGGVWLWGEVNSWLRRVGKQHDDVEHPTREDYAEIALWLTEMRAPHVDLPAGPVFQVTLHSGAIPGPRRTR